MIRTLPLTISLLALALAACTSRSGGDNAATSIRFNANDGNGAMSAGIDKSGNLRINVPGFNGDLKVPKLQLDASDFDMNGVHLYPGSTISSINIDGQDGKGRADKSGKVRLSFNSPAPAATVHGWLKDRLTRAGFTLTDSGTGLTGKTDKGRPFVLNLTDQGAGKASGSIVMGD